MSRYAARRDATHNPIVQGLKARGIAVVNMPDPGDVLCYFRGTFQPLEFKTARSTKDGGAHGLTKKQAATRAAGLPIPVVETLEQALTLFMEFKAET